jgi:hypothetical protein
MRGAGGSSTTRRGVRRHESDRMGAAHRARGRAETPRGDTVHHGVDEASVHRTEEQSTRDGRTGARSRGWPASSPLFLISFARFQNCETLISL